MAEIIDGKRLAEKIRNEIKLRTASIKTPIGLAVVLVGENPASQIYVRSKKKACAEVGFKSFEYTMPETATQEEILDVINGLNTDRSVHGILVQLPLPKHIDEKKVIMAISPDKDVDGFHPLNMGRLLVGDKGPRPCTPEGVMEMIRSTGTDITGKQAVVIGRSNIVGKPVGIMLLENHATVTICHSRTRDLPKIAVGADILVAAIGKPHFVKGDWIKKGAIVIDVGINRISDGKVVGDVDFESAKKRAGFISPVPGGVGPMTIAMLLRNTIKASY